jgi:AbiJ N-terminal domain 3
MARMEAVVSNEISEVTRRAIFDSLMTSGTDWAGRLAEDDFLARLYDLTKMPSTDPRVRTAAADIHQHRINWRDWEDDWVFYDSRFNLLRGSDDEFLGFLCETVHPVVRPNTDGARDLVVSYNQELSADGWSLAETKQISGKPVFKPHKLGTPAKVFTEPRDGRKLTASSRRSAFG